MASYAFTTLKPIPAICNINGASVQFVEVPGLIEGAHEGKGMGRKLLSVAKGADFVIVVHNLGEPVAELMKTIRELQVAGLNDISLIVGTSPTYRKHIATSSRTPPENGRGAFLYFMMRTAGGGFRSPPAF